MAETDLPERKGLALSMAFDLPEVVIWTQKYKISIQTQADDKKYYKFISKRKISYFVYSITINFPLKTSDIPLETYASTTQAVSSFSAR